MRILLKLLHWLVAKVLHDLCTHAETDFAMAPGVCVTAIASTFHRMCIATCLQLIFNKIPTYEGSTVLMSGNTVRLYGEHKLCLNVLHAHVLVRNLFTSNVSSESAVGLQVSKTLDCLYLATSPATKAGGWSPPNPHPALEMK